MKTKQPKTRIVRIIGGESYFVRHDSTSIDGIPEGEFRWEEFRKDTSGICRAYHDTRFKSMGNLSRTPRPCGVEPIRPIPENYATSLLSPFARNEYAPGHEPLKPLHLR